ncbi:DoxX family protein [Actinosynnema sp. CA-248983]
MNRVRPAVFWVATFLIVFELLAGGVWNLASIKWIDDQLAHLGFPDYFDHVLGVCQPLAAVAIAVPGFRLLKEWAYAGVFFLWAGAVVSFLVMGDTVISWGPPLMFLVLAVTSWALRPADRRLTAAPSRPTTRQWAASIGLVVALLAVSILTLPAADDLTRDWAAERGWVQQS